MGYISTGATGAQVMQAASVQSVFAPAGTVWCPPAGGKAGYYARKRSDGQSPCGPVTGSVTVRETPADTIRTTCNKWGFGSEKAAMCEQWLRAGKPRAQLPSVFACVDKGYTGQSLEMCIDGRLKSASFEEIDQVINELATQAGAAQQAQLQQEQALVAARKRRTYLILGGLAAAGAVGFLIWKKRKGRKAKPSSPPTLTKA
jgi:hypothetical protein